MKAVPFFEHGPVDVLHYRDVPDPVPRKDQVVIDVECCGLNHLDIWTRQGIPGKTIKLPHVSGCDIVGTVRTKAPGLKAGERVMVYPGVSCGRCEYCKDKRENLCSQFAIIGGMSDWNGGYAEQVAVPAKNVVKIGSMRSEIATTLAVSYLTAWNMLSTNGAGRGKTVLVYGAASGVGMATIQLAKALGCTVITTASNKEKMNFAKKIGAHYVIDRTAQDITAEARKIADRGVDIVIDHVGAATWATSIAALRQGGRMAVCGMTSGNDATVPVRTFYSKQVVMTGALMGTKAQLLELVSFVKRKKIRPVVDSILPLEQAVEAQKKMEEGRHAGKILLAV
jgi:NADPH:quinone reductase-like Zn-dependent oxidoreductase